MKSQDDGYNCGLHVAINMLPFIGGFSGYDVQTLNIKTKNIVDEKKSLIMNHLLVMLP